MKVLGIIMVSVGVLFVPLTFLSIVGMLVSKHKPRSSNSSYVFGYYLGQVLFVVLLAAISFLLIKYGNRFIKKVNQKKFIHKEIQDIGQ